MSALDGPLPGMAVGRLAFFCDVSDTVAGAAQLRNGEMPFVARVWLLGPTGTYAAIGAARTLEDARDE